MLQVAFLLPFSLLYFLYFSLSCVFISFFSTFIFFSHSSICNEPLCFPLFYFFLPLCPMLFSVSLISLWLTFFSLYVYFLVLLSVTCQIASLTPPFPSSAVCVYLYLPQNLLTALLRRLHIFFASLSPRCVRLRSSSVVFAFYINPRLSCVLVCLSLSSLIFASRCGSHHLQSSSLLLVAAQRTTGCVVIPAGVSGQVCHSLVHGCGFVGASRGGWVQVCCRQVWRCWDVISVKPTGVSNSYIDANV